MTVRASPPGLESLFICYLVGQLVGLFFHSFNLVGRIAGSLVSYLFGLLGHCTGCLVGWFAGYSSIFLDEFLNLFMPGGKIQRGLFAALDYGKKKTSGVA